jgi:uncharacterized membrane protein YraQ (UPF0718 family)
MLYHITQIVNYVVESFLHIWPYLLITIPIAVAVNMSGASKYISKAFSARPMVSIILATFVGAFSPFCSCGVIPVVAALLIGGVPLAPVMSFWLASPSMDPEIFFLSVSMLGWDLALWRLIATLVLSLSGGFLTHLAVQSGWIGANFMRKNRSTSVKSYGQVFRDGIQVIRQKLSPQKLATEPALGSNEEACCSPEESTQPLQLTTISMTMPNTLPVIGTAKTDDAACDCEDDTAACCEPEAKPETNFWPRLTKETWDATTLVIKFMLLAWLIGGLITLYVPEAWITNTLGGSNSWAIISSALLGVPVYTNNLMAMPLIGGLLEQGMNPAAALAFLIAGPMTTLPAMSAVWGLVNRKVFSLYLSFALVGAVALGYVYNIVLSF